MLLHSYRRMYDNAKLTLGGGGGGGGVHPDFFVKLDFEIAVDQQTRAGRDRTPVPAGQPRP